MFLCRNPYYRDMYSWRKTFLYCVLIWVCCFALELPNFVGWGGHTYDLKTMSCSYDRLADMSYTFFFCAVAIGLPLIAVCVSYSLILRYVRSIRKELSVFTGSVVSASTVKAQNRQQAEIQLAKTLFIAFIVFVVCWAPYAVVVIIDYEDQWSKIVYVVVIQLAHTCSSVNFIIYAAMNKRFRKGYQYLLRCTNCVPRKHTIPDSDISLVTSSTSSFKWDSDFMYLKVNFIYYSDIVHSDICFIANILKITNNMYIHWYIRNM